MKTSSESLWNLLNQLLAVLSSQLLSSSSKDPQPLLCIIDAVEECVDTTDLQFLHRLDNDLRTSPYPIKILITCRRDYMERIPSDIAIHSTISIEEENAGDIQLYVKHHLQHVSSASSDLETVSKLETEIITLAQGIFLWAALVIEGLFYRAVPLQDILETVRRCHGDPNDRLTKLYGEILKQATKNLNDEQLVTDIHSILKIVLATRIPFWFSEIQECLEVDATNSMRLNLEHNIKTICRGILTVEGDLVRPVHLTLQTYLEDSARCLPQFYISQHEKHIYLARICLKYTIKRLKTAVSDEQENIQALLDETPFLKHAAVFWLYHVNGSETADSNLIELIQDLLGNTASFQKWYRVILISKNEILNRLHLFGLSCDDTTDVSLIHPTPAHILSLVTVPLPFFQALFQNKAVPAFSHEALGPQNLDSQDRTPAHWAAGCSRQILNPAFSAAGYMANLRSSPTTIPQEPEGAETLSYILTSFPESVNRLNKFGQTPLHIACSSEHCYYKVKRLLDAKADIEIQDARSMSALHLCAAPMCLEAARLLVASNANVNVLTKDGETPLHYAALHGQDSTVELLIDNGAGVNTVDNNGSSPLHWAVYRDTDYAQALMSAMVEHEVLDSDEAAPKRFMSVFLNSFVAREETIRRLVAAGADVNHKNSWGNTALHDAANFGYLLCVKTLLSLKADPNIRNDAGWTPLTGAIYQGTESIVDLLISAGADTNLRDLEGESILHHAAKMGYPSLTSRFIKAGTDIDVRTIAGISPLGMSTATNLERAIQLIVSRQGEKTRNGVMDAIKKRKRGAWLKDHEETVQILLSAGADVNAVAGDGSTPLFMAAFHGHEPIVRILLKNGANFKTVGENGRSVLHSAGLAGSDECIETLLKAGAEIKATNDGMTPLIGAVQYGHVSTVKLLIEAGNKVDSADDSGLTALHYAAAFAQRHFETSEAKPEKQDDPNKRTNADLELSAMAQKGRDWETFEADQIESVTLLLSNGAKVNQIDSTFEFTPLMFAALQERVELMKVLLDFGAVKSHFNIEGTAAIHVAIDQGNTGVIRLLLERGDDPDRRTKSDMTPLTIAGSSQNIEIMQLLLDRGADINAKIQGSPGLHKAIEEGLSTTVKWAIEHGVDLKATDSNGKNALDIAYEKDKKDIVQQLLDAGATRGYSVGK